MSPRALQGIALAALLYHSVVVIATAHRHPPTALEPALLASGLAHWEFARFEPYCVNPPLIKLQAALPVWWVGYQADWSPYFEGPGARSEFGLGVAFVRVNGERTRWLVTLGRWACLPWTILGAIVAYGFAREFWHREGAGCAACVLWCLDPLMLGHGPLLTNDVPCATAGLAATWLFWRWLKLGGWSAAGWAGVALGMALLTKLSWLLLWGLWPVLWGLAAMGRRWGYRTGSAPSLTQLSWLLLVSLYVLNLGYAFTGTGTRLGEFQFVSRVLSGQAEAGEPGNRWRESWLGELPLPFPADFVRGIDLQKKDFEKWNKPSYLRGKQQQGGWWYYYLYGLWVKEPHGIQLWWLMSILLPAVNLAVPSSSRSLLPLGEARWFDQLVLVLPGFALFVLVSAQLEFNEHFRYVIPSIATLHVYAGRLGTLFESDHELRRSDGVLEAARPN